MLSVDTQVYYGKMADEAVGETKDSSELNLDEEDIFDMCALKGTCMDAFRKEYEDLQSKIETEKNNLLSINRELEGANKELLTVKDQINFTQRNIDELVSAQEGITDGNDHKRSIKSNLEDREANNRSEIRTFTSLSDELKSALSVGSDWRPDQLEQRAALEKERDFLQAKLENRMAQVKGVRGDADRTYERIQTVETETKAVEKDQKEVQEKYDSFVKEAERLGSNKLSEEERIFSLRADALKLASDFDERRRVLKLDKKNLDDLDGVLVTTKERMEKNIKEYDTLYKTLQEITHKLEKQKNVNKKSEVDIEDRKKYIEERTGEVEVNTKEIVKQQKLSKLCKEKIATVDQEKMDIEAKKDDLERKFEEINRVEIVAVTRSIEHSVKQLAILKQDMEGIRKKVTNSEKAAKQMADFVLMNRNGKRNLGVEEKTLLDEVQLQKIQIKAMLEEKEKFEHDVENVNQQYYTALEELKLQDLQITELQNKIMEDQAKLKHKQTLYEAVRSDRNLFSKQLTESQDNIQELRRKFRFMNHNIEQLKEEISVKDHAIVKEHFLHHSVDKERELLKNELTKIRKQVLSSEGIIENQRVELLKLNRIIEEADQERRRQRNELNSIQSERKLLTGQIVKRNAELGEMYDKIKLQRSNLRIGERNYNKVTAGIAQWREELKSIVYTHENMVEAVVGIGEQKHKVAQLDKELLTLRTKARALMDEFDKPLNVHRWRLLESSDPKRYEKILQIQALQKELVEKSDEALQADLLIQEKEKAYIELKKIIARQPGPEVEEQVLVYQQTYKDKAKQLDGMNDELDMYRQQTKVFKEDLNRVEKEMDRVKKKWFKIRREQELGGTGDQVGIPN